MNSDILASVSNLDFEYVESDAKEYALTIGLCSRLLNSNNDDLVQSVKFTLFPSPFPKKWFTFAQSIQRNYNLLYHRISYDDQFLTESLQEIIKVDDFTRNLFNIYLKVRDDKKAQKISLGIFRSDYMLQNNPQSLKQIEMNTISVSCKGLVSRLNDLHRYILNHYVPNLIKYLPDPQSDQDLAIGLIKAWELYDNKEAIILMVTQDRPVTICDQKSVQIAIYRMRPEIKVVRKSFANLSNELKMNSENQIFVNEKEVAIVYYRTAYAPRDYKLASYWKIRETLELSTAIKCPSIRYQLAGVKKIQQILTNYDQLKKFLNSNEQLDEIFSTFVKIYHLKDNKEGRYAVQTGLQNPESYVLKPQREGGGNNYFGKDLVSKINEITVDQERNAYILMELIKPTPVYNYLISPNESISGKEREQIISELGIFGTIIGDDQKVYYNSESGYLLRSKNLSANEGCVSMGLGTIDSPLLT